MENFENVEKLYFPSKFCLLQRIILHVKRVRNAEFEENSISTLHVFLRVQVVFVRVHFVRCSNFCSSSGEMQLLLQLILEMTVE